MKVIPAVDLENQKSVRLYQGNFDQATLIDEKPVEQAQKIENSGLNNLHLIDLDGAKFGRPINRQLVYRICQQTNLKVEVGGGIRTLAQVNAYLTGGVNRVILGSSALDNPQLVKRAINLFGSDQIVIAIDGKDGEVAISGWVKKSNIKMQDLLSNMLAFGAKQFLVTDISKDGTLKGPNIKLLSNLRVAFPKVNIIAAGGISNLKDLKELKKVGINSAVVGRALATGDLPLATLREVNSYDN